MAFAKGESGNPSGRPTGTPNKINASLKEMILAALEGEGGVEYLRQRARDLPAAFLALLGKVLPMTLHDERIKSEHPPIVVYVPTKMPIGWNPEHSQTPASNTT